MTFLTLVGRTNSNPLLNAPCTYIYAPPLICRLPMMLGAIPTHRHQAQPTIHTKCNKCNNVSNAYFHDRTQKEHVFLLYYVGFPSGTAVCVVCWRGCVKMCDRRDLYIYIYLNSQNIADNRCKRWLRRRYEASTVCKHFRLISGQWVLTCEEPQPSLWLIKEHITSTRIARPPKAQGVYITKTSVVFCTMKMLREIYCAIRLFSNWMCRNNNNSRSQLLYYFELTTLCVHACIYKQLFEFVFGINLVRNILVAQFA